MRRHVKLKKGSKKHIKYIVLTATVLLLYLVHLSMKPVIETVSRNQARILCTTTINKAVLAELEKADVDYNSLVTITSDAAGNVSTIETDAVQLNLLKTRLTETVNNSLLQLPQQDVRIPLGTLTGIELLSGRGPGVRLKMLPSSYVESAIISSFDSAGINQTRHMILIEFTVTMSAIIAPYVTELIVTSSVVIAETVIVGTVPNIYANMGQNE